MKQEPTTAQALAALISEKAARLDHMKQAGRELETRCNDKKALRHLATAYEIALYCFTSTTNNETTRPDECREGNNTTITKLKLLHYERIRFHGRHR